MRDEIRKRFFASRNRRFNDIETVMDGEPTKIRIRQPSIRERAKIFEVGKFSETGKIADWMASEQAKVLAIITCCHDPDSDERLFDERDKENLFAQAELVDTLAARCFEVLKPVDVKRAEEIEGNSEPTPSAS